MPRHRCSSGRPSSATPTSSSRCGRSTHPTPNTPVSSPVERTGTTVVLGRGHLITLGAMLLVLIGGIAALGYVALTRGNVPWQTAAAPAAEGLSPAGDAPTALPVSDESPVVGEPVVIETATTEPP